MLEGDPVKGNGKIGMGMYVDKRDGWSGKGRGVYCRRERGGFSWVGAETGFWVSGVGLVVEGRGGGESGGTCGRGVSYWVRNRYTGEQSKV